MFADERDRHDGGVPAERLAEIRVARPIDSLNQLGLMKCNDGPDDSI